MFRHKDERASVGRASSQPVPSPLSQANASAPVKGERIRARESAAAQEDRSDFRGRWKGSRLEQRETLEKGPSHAHLCFQVGDQEGVARFYWRPERRQTPSAAWPLDRNRSRRCGLRYAPPLFS